MGTEEQRQNQAASEYLAENVAADFENLLDSVLDETDGGNENLELIQDVAKNSEHSAPHSLGCFEELVSAILKTRFGALLNDQRLIQRIAQTLFDSPEARKKLEAIWIQARAGEQ